MDSVYKASVGNTIFDLDVKNVISLNGEEQTIQFQKLQKSSYSFLINEKETIADIVKIDYDTKQITLRIDGKKYTIGIKEPIQLQLEKLGITLLPSKKANNLKAPMPGLVLKLMVKEGDEVKAGEPLLILEAMKMENVFKAMHDLKIATIKVNEKQAVEKGQELMTFA